MDELMLHVVDIAMNSVSAGARTVKIGVREDLAADDLTLCVADNGPGMSAELVDKVLHDYATTKTKQKGWVGFGLALLRGTVELVEGRFHLLSRPGVGTLVVASLPHSHLDRPPLGSVVESLETLLVGCRRVDFCWTHRIGPCSFRLDTRTVRRELGEAYATATVRRHLTAWLTEGERALRDGRDG